MTRVNEFALAKKIAENRNEYFGLCSTDGFYYIGSREELKRIPVLIKVEYKKEDK